MAIHSARRQSDPRIVCGILAREVLASWPDHQAGQPLESEDLKVYLTNLIRLLEMYRYDSFALRESPGVLVLRSNRTAHARYAHRVERLELVKQAFDSATNDVFPDHDKAQVIAQVTNVLRAMHSGAEVDPNNKANARRFLESLRAHLSAIE